MAINKIDARIWLKLSTVSGQTPTMGFTNNPYDGTFAVTDLSKGEGYVNVKDNKAWLRFDDTIKEFAFKSDIPTGTTGNYLPLTISNDTTVNSVSANTLNFTGFSSINRSLVNGNSTSTFNHNATGNFYYNYLNSDTSDSTTFNVYNTGLYFAGSDTTNSRTSQFSAQPNNLYYASSDSPLNKYVTFQVQPNNIYIGAIDDNLGAILELNSDNFNVYGNDGFTTNFIFTFNKDKAVLNNANIIVTGITGTANYILPYKGFGTNETFAMLSDIPTGFTANYLPVTPLGSERYTYDNNDGTNTTQLYFGEDFYFGKTRNIDGAPIFQNEYSSTQISLNISDPDSPSTFSSIVLQPNNGVQLFGKSGNYVSLKTENVGAFYNIQFPNKSSFANETFAMLSDIPTGSTTGATYIAGSGITITANTISVDNTIARVADLANKQDALSGTGFVKISGTTVSYDNNTYVQLSGVAATGRIGIWVSGNALSSNGGLTWVSNVLSTPILQISGNGGNGYLRYVTQTTRPVSIALGDIRTYCSNANELGWVRRNNANSTTIFREFNFPDTDITVTYPTPDVGGADTVAYRSSINSFSVVQRFSNAGLTVNDGTSDILALNSPATNVLRVGTGFPTVNIGNSFVTSTSSATALGTAGMLFRASNISPVGSSALNIGLNNSSTNTLNIGGTFNGASYVGFGGITGAYAVDSTPSVNLFTVGNSMTGGTGNINIATGLNTGGGTRGNINLSAATVNISSNLQLTQAGNGLQIKTGSNARAGVTSLTGGTAVILNNSITTNTSAFVTPRGAGAGYLNVTYSGGTGFTITSSDIIDTRTIDWFLIERI